MDRRRHTLVPVVGSFVVALMLLTNPAAAGSMAARAGAGAGDVAVLDEAAFERGKSLPADDHRYESDPAPRMEGERARGSSPATARNRSSNRQPARMGPPWTWPAFAGLNASDQRRAIANLRALLSIERNRATGDGEAAADPLQVLRAHDAPIRTRSLAEASSSGAAANDTGGGVRHAATATIAPPHPTSVAQGERRSAIAGARMAGTSARFFSRLMGSRGDLTPDHATRIVALLAGTEPRTALELALLELRLIEALGGWIAVDPERARSLGDPDLVARLVQTGDLDIPALGSPPPDRATLEDALRRFQARHGLAADGILGPRTAAALKRPVAAQIASLSSNLRRERDTRRPRLASRYVEVDIPGMTLRLVENGAVRLQTRVIVGRSAKPTPDLADTIRYIDLDPSWYVPASIVPELLARESLEPGYLEAAGFRRQTSADGSERLVQAPGPANALGRFKFGFPNRHAVYLHDTPHRNLFEETARDLSHGCVRVEDPRGLALALLERTGWTAERLQERLAATPRTRRITLAEPVPVFLRYRTAFIGKEGRLHFRADPYNRDAPGSLRIVARNEEARQAAAMPLAPDPDLEEAAPDPS